MATNYDLAYAIYQKLKLTEKCKEKIGGYVDSMLADYLANGSRRLLKERLIWIIEDQLKVIYSLMEAKKETPLDEILRRLEAVEKRLEEKA